MPSDEVVLLRTVDDRQLRIDKDGARDNDRTLPRAKGVLLTGVAPIAVGAVVSVFSLSDQPLALSFAVAILATMVWMVVAGVVNSMRRRRDGVARGLATNQSSVDFIEILGEKVDPSLHLALWRARNKVLNGVRRTGGVPTGGPAMAFEVMDDLLNRLLADDDQRDDVVEVLLALDVSTAPTDADVAAEALAQIEAGRIAEAERAAQERAAEAARAEAERAAVGFSTADDIRRVVARRTDTVGP